MSSFKFAQVAGAVSQNLGLFAERAGEKEKREAGREWDLKLEEIRAARAASAEKRGYAHSEQLAATRATADTERYKAGQISADRRHGENLANTKDYQQQQLLSKKEESFQKRLDEIMKSYQEELDSPMYMGEDPENKLATKYADRRDQAVVNFVERMSKRNEPGYEDAMSSPDAFINATGMWGVHGDAATDYAGELFAEPDQNPMTSYLMETEQMQFGPGQTQVPSQMPPQQTTAAAQLPGGLDANSMQGVAGQPINMVQPTPSGGYRSPNQRMIDNVMKPGAAAVGDWLGKPRQDPNENPYALMGQQGG